MIEYLAWTILAVFYLLTVVPLVGTTCSFSNGYYLADFRAGLVVHFGLAAFLFVIIAVVWAVIEVSN